jgi:hypothetical protein
MFEALRSPVAFIPNRRASDLFPTLLTLTTRSRRSHRHCETASSTLGMKCGPSSQPPGSTSSVATPTELYGGTSGMLDHGFDSMYAVTPR